MYFIVSWDSGPVVYAFQYGKRSISEMYSKKDTGKFVREKEEMKRNRRNRYHFISDRIILPCKLFIAHFP